MFPTPDTHLEDTREPPESNVEEVRTEAIDELWTEGQAILDAIDAYNESWEAHMSHAGFPEDCENGEYENAKDAVRRMVE